MLVVAAMLLAALNPGAAVGHHGGRPIGSFLNCDRPGIDPPRCTSVADNLRHYVYFDATLNDGLAASLRDTMAEDYDPTDLSLAEHAEITALTDVIAFSQDYGENGAAGWLYCPTIAPQGLNSYGHRWCRHQELHFNLNPRYAVFFADDASRDHITCHELGHTIGLRHWGNPPQSAGPEAYTCMNANTPDGPVELHEIDIAHINAYTYDTRPPSRRHELVASGSDGTRGASPATAGWDASGLHAHEVEHYGSLRDMSRAADVVVRARATAVVAGRVFGDPSGGGLAYAAVTLSVSELLAGATARVGGDLTLEIPLFDGQGSLAALRSSLVGDEGIFFLRNKGESARAAHLPRDAQLAEARFYRLMVFGALVLNDAGRATLTPDAPDFMSGLNDLPFDRVARRVSQEMR